MYHHLEGWGKGCVLVLVLSVGFFFGIDSLHSM